MNQELEDKLMEKFPWFEARNVWTGKKLSIPHPCECDDGWYDLIYNFCKDTEELYKSKNEDIFDIIIVQIKEKYGTLRIYLAGYLDGIDNIITKYENLSAKTCEICGDKGKLSTDGFWYKTLCDKHRKGLSFKETNEEQLL